MDKKVEIALCMGSSCFAKGSGALLEMLEDLVKTRGWEDKVSLSGLRCEDRCTDGPNIRIDDTLYQKMDEGALIDALETKLGGGNSNASRSSVRLSSVRKLPDRKGS